ncbi:MAG: tetratricopeptide repeat protein [Lachnospiraceae bacterium]
MDRTINKNYQIANSYYNRGLEMALQRDLTGAIRNLKRSLLFYKFQTDARNLLGLIYYELGEVGSALTQWIISLNLKQQDNLAEEYLQRLHAAYSYLEMTDQAGKKFNQALIYAQNDNQDLAILLLMRLLGDMPNYVKAQLLLALLYMEHEDYTKAGRCLYQALKVDKQNPKAQRYMAIVKENTGRAEIERRKLKNAFSHRQMQDDDIIIPPSYKENTGWQSILNILVGLLIGAAVIFFLVLPANRESINNKHNQELQRYMEQLNQKSIEIDDLNRRMEQAGAAQQAAADSLQTLLDENGGVLSQYQSLSRILKAYLDEDMRTAVVLYTDLDVSVLQDGVLDETLGWLTQEMQQNGYQVLLQMGDGALAQNGAQQAIDYYQRSLKIYPDNPQAIYQIGLAYTTLDNTDTANQFFGDIIMNHPNSEYAARAREQRGY